MGRVLLRRGTPPQDQAMILIDTSVIVAWLDVSHPEHPKCKAALTAAAAKNQLAVSSVTFAELAAGSRTREAVDEALKEFEILPLDVDSAWRAGHAFRRYRPKNHDNLVLPDFFIRAQAAVNNCPHLTNDRRRMESWPDVDFVFP